MKTDMISTYLAQNIERLRTQKNLSQLRLAQLSGIPRTTITNIESSAGNPSLHNLVKISAALGVGIEELLSRPRSDCLLVRAADVPVVSRQQGRVQLHKLLPDKIKGIETDRMALAAEAVIGGHPHLEGTKKYIVVSCMGLQGLQLIGRKFVQSDRAWAFLLTFKTKVCGIITTT